MKLIDAEKLVNSFDDAVRDVYDGPLYLVHMAEGKRKQLRAQLIAALCEDKWIPITDIMPEPYMTFLAWLPDEEEKVQKGFFDSEFGEEWFIGEYRFRFKISEVTHYQPLLEGPREEH